MNGKLVWRLAFNSSSTKKVWATGAGSARPVVSIRIASNLVLRRMRRPKMRMRSPRTVQQTHLQQKAKGKRGGMLCQVRTPSDVATIRASTISSGSKVLESRRVQVQKQEQGWQAQFFVFSYPLFISKISSFDCSTKASSTPTSPNLVIHGRGREGREHRGWHLQSGSAITNKRREGWETMRGELTRFR
jgi:hypothetical protein